LVKVIILKTKLRYILSGRNLSKKYFNAFTNIQIIQTTNKNPKIQFTIDKISHHLAKEVK
jgi:hypothetical protein